MAEGEGDAATISAVAMILAGFDPARLIISSNPNVIFIDASMASCDATDPGSCGRRRCRGPPSAMPHRHAELPRAVPTYQARLLCRRADPPSPDLSAARRRKPSRLLRAASPWPASDRVPSSWPDRRHEDGELLAVRRARRPGRLAGP